MEEPVDLPTEGGTKPSASEAESQTDGSSKDQEQFCCSFCQEKFTAIEDLLSHIRIHTGGVDSEEDQDEMQVPQKMKRLSVRLPLLKTGRLSSLESNDGGGDGQGVSVNEFERTDATPGYQCPTCKRRFSRIIHQLNHKCEPTQVENRLDAINSSLKLFKCVICKEEFGTRQEKLDHKCLSQKSQPQEEAESPNLPPDLADNDDQDMGDNQEDDYESGEDDSGTASGVGDAAHHVSLKLAIKAPTKKGFGRARRRKAKANHRCNICHRSFTRSWNLKVHMQKTHAPGSPIQPKISPANSSPRASPRPVVSPRATHKTQLISKSAADMIPSESDGPFDFDFTPSYSEKNMTLRRVPSSNAYECPLCGRTMERREAMLSHIRDHRSETPYQCSHCDFKCTHSAKIIKHLNQTHRIAQPNNPPLFEAMKAQTQDSDWQPRKEPYRNFYKIVRSEKERMYKPKKVAATGAFECPICRKAFARFGVAQVHIRIHTGEAPFRCLLCEYQGKQQSLILAHLEHNHKEIISNSNSHRDEEVDAELAMEDGDEDVDEEEWEKSIDFEEGIINDKREENETALQENESESAESSENQQPPENIPPEFDGYDFKFRPTQNELDRVLFRSSLTKMFLCHLCTKEIKEKEIMLAHIRTHTGDKAYYCCHCDFGSAHDAAMRKHLLNVHGIKHAKRPENNVQTNVRLTSKRPPSKPVMVTRTKDPESPKTSTKVKKSTNKSIQEQSPQKAPIEEKVKPEKMLAKVKKEPAAPKQPKTGPSYADFYIVDKSEKEEQCKPQRNEDTGLYKCHFCKLESYSYKTVVIHTRSHTGEKPYKCRLCTFSGGQSSHVIRHLKNTHRVSLDDDGQSDDADDEPPELEKEEEQKPQEKEEEEDRKEEQEEQLDQGNDAEMNYSEDDDIGGEDVDADVDLAPVDYFAPSIPEEPMDIPPPKLHYKDEDSQDDTVEEGSQEGGDNDPDWETWMDRSTLNTEVRSAYKGKGKGKLTSPKNAKVNYIFAPSDAEKQLDLKRGADKQFECPTCGKKMREMEIILAHIRTHTGEKPYICCHCDFMSAHIASIRKHIIRVHHVKRPIAGSDHKTPLTAPGRVQVTPEPKKKTLPAPVLESGVSPEKAGDFEDTGVDMEERPYSEGTSEGFINKFFKVAKRVKPKEKKYIPTREPVSGRAQCRICKGTFSSYGKAVVHIRCHTGEKPYECLLCDYKSSQNPNMKRHIRNQHKEALYGNVDPQQLKPKEAGEGFDADDDDHFAEPPAVDDDDDHDLSGPSMVQRTDFLSQAALSEQHTNRKGRPDYLYEPTERMRNFEPKRSSTTGMFECTYCSSQFYGLKKIETHVLKHTGEKPYLCMHCDFKSAYSFVMYRHLLKRHQIQTPNHPGSASDNLDEIKDSEQQDMETSTYSEGQESDSAYTTTKPETSETLPNSAVTSQPTYPEGEFDFVFRPSDFELGQVIESAGGGRLKCPHCKKVMSNRKKMVTHIRTHTGEKPFHCCHCDFKTAYKFVIQTHMKGIHKILEPKGDDELIEAQRAQRSGESLAAGTGDTEGNFDPQNVVIKQEPLDETEMATDGNNPGRDGFSEMVANMSAEVPGGVDSANDDTSSMDDGESSNYSIQKEGQKPDCVFRPTDAEKNRKLYRPSPSGPSQCPYCSRWLQGLENMRAHIRGHTGEKPYLCCHCDQKSAHFAAIKRHLIKVHKLKRPVMPGDVAPHLNLKQNADGQKRPGLVVKFKNVSFPSSPLKPTQTKFKPQMSKSAASRARSLAPFTSRDRSLTTFYRNFYTVKKSEEMKKFTPKKDPATKLFHCNFCEKQFNYHTEAQVHTRTHTGEKPYECLVCDYKGSQWTNIIRHITCVHKKVLEARQREEGIGNLPPEESKESDQNDMPLDMSRTTQVKSTPEDNVDPYVSQKDDSYELQKVITYEPKQGALPTSPNVQADYVFNPTDEERKRVIVPSPKTGLYSCLYCKKKVPNLGKIVTHIRTHTGDKPYVCCHCNFKSAYKFVIRQHLSGRHGIKWPKTLVDEADDKDTSPALGDFPQDMQRKPAMSPIAGAGRHVKSPNWDFRFQPSEREQTMELSRQQRTGCFECPYCGRQFSSSETMKAHIRGHTGDKAYYCNHCTFASAHIKSIRNHIQKVHNIVHPRRNDHHDTASTSSVVQVPQPPRVVPASQIPKEIYLKYVGVNKTGPKKFPPRRNPRTGRFKCHFCTMESKQLYTVEIHTMRHTGERPYHCKLCEYKATRQWLVTQHLQTNHKHILAANEGLTLIPKETMEPPAPTAVKLPQSEIGADGIVVCRSAKTGMYYCSECRKEFITSSQCREHINTHSGDKPYQCPFCDHRSAHGGAMRNHMKIQHGNDSDELKKWYTYTMGKIALRHMFQRDPEGMYMCTYCNKKSSSLNSARKHLCVHTGEKPYSCKLCSFKAIHNISIRLHVTGHHKQITKAFSQGKAAASTSSQTGLKNLAQETMKDLGEEDVDEDEWEDADEALQDEKLATGEQGNLGEMEGALQQYKTTSPLSAVAPVGQVSVKDADFLYVPSEFDRDVVLQRSRDSQMYECPICSKQMTNTRTMRAHIRLHKGEKAYHCCHCDYKSAHYSVLRKHVVQVHKIQRPRMAQEPDEQDVPHVPQHESPMKDAAGEQEPSSLDDLHLENPSKIPTNMNPESDQGFMFDANEEEKTSWQELQSTGSCQCPQCGKQCSSPIRTLQHMRTHTGAKPYYCKYCSFRSAYDTSMRNHVKTMHEATGGVWSTGGSSHKSTGSEIQALQRSLEDDREMEDSNTLAEMKALAKQSSGRSEVKVKQEPADNGYENKSSDVDSDAPPEMAWTFNEEDQSATLVPQYMAPPIIEEDNSGPPSFHPESSPGSDDHGTMDMLQPEIREKTPSLMQRYKTMSSPPLQPKFAAGDFTYTPSQQEKDRVVGRSPSSGQYKCPFCPQELTSVDKIKAHIRKHTGDRPYQCLHCKFSSAYRFVIRTHIKNLHKIPEPKQDKSGTVGGNLMSQVNGGKSKIPVSRSDLATVYKPVLVDEKRSSPKRFLAAGKVSWDEHYKYIPSEAEKKLILHRCSSTGKFQCPDCSKVLNSIDVMRAHIRTHTGEKPYYCCHCYFRSAHYDSMRKHLIVIHKLKQEGGDQIVDPSDENQDAEQEWQQLDFKRKSQVQIPPTASRGPDFTFKPSEYEKKCKPKQDLNTGLLQCPQCPKQHRSSDGVLAHLRSHTGDKPYRCSHCEYSCPHLSAIKLHLYIIHNITQPIRPDKVMIKSPLFKKPSSDKEDKCEMDKYRHLFSVTKDSKKNRKGQIFKRNPVTRAYKCNYCPKESKHHYVIQIHMRMHTGEKPYQCLLCDYRGAQQSRIIFHLKGKHADYLKAHGIEDQHNPVEECREDVGGGDEFVQSFQPQQENAGSNTEHYVPKLGVDFTMERIESEEIILEQLQQSRDYRCPTCGKRCANAVRTIEHMRQHTGAKPYACMRCSTRSAYDRAMRNHVLLQHGRNAKEKEKLYTFHMGKIERSLELRKDPKTDRFICPFCEKTFRDVNLARSHVRMHTGELPYKCKLCKYRGANTRAIQVHIERVHGNRGGTVPFAAPPTGEILRNRLKLTDDNLSVPSEGSAQDSASDDSRSKSDQDKVGKPFAGPKLGVDFTCDKIETDNMYCIDPESGGYKCLYCDRVIKSRLVSKIQTHLLCHTGAKPFKCVQCGFRSAHDGSMRSHVLSQHRKISRAYEKLYKFKVGKIERSLRLDQEPSGAYVCPYCPKRCKDLYVAKKHIRSHTGEKPYRCRKCSYMASVKWSVILHAQRQHKSKKRSSKSKHESNKETAGLNDTELPTIDEEGDRKDEQGKVVKISSENLDAGKSTEKSAVENEISLDKGVKVGTNDKPGKEAAPVTTIPKLSEQTDKVEDSNTTLVNTDNNNEIDNNNENNESVSKMDATETKDETLESKSDVVGVGTLEIDGIAEMNVDVADEEGTAGVEKKVTFQKSENKDASDVDEKLEVDLSPDQIEKPTDAESKNKDADESKRNKQKVTDMDEKLSLKVQESRSDEKAEDVINSDFVEKLNTKVEVKVESQTGELEEKVTSNDVQMVKKILDEVKQEVTLRKANAPDYIFLPSEEEKNLSKSNATGSFTCPHCSKHFSDIVVMQTHVRNHTGDTPYHCTHCTFKSVRFPEIRQHLLFVHKIHRPKTIQQSKPVPPQKKVSSMPAVVDIYRSFFTFVQSKKSNFKPTRNALTGLYECPDCGSTSKRSNGARVHYRTHTGEKPYHCLLCSYRGAQQSRVVTHIKYNHQDVLKSQKTLVPSKSEGPEKPEPSEEGDDFKEDFDIMGEERSLVINEASFEEEKGIKRKNDVDVPVPIKAAHEPMWKKGYEYRPSEAENEMILEQDNSGSFMCPICPHKHKLKNVVRNHVRKHTGEKPYYCCHCDFTTANFSSMRTHLIQAHKSMPHKADTPSLDQEIGAKRAKLEEDKLPLAEETPTEGYTFTRSLLEKSLTLQRTARGKYQCPYCSYEYGALAIVMAHVRTHTGDKPFQCNYCPYSAADYSAMRKHLIKKHDKWQPKAKVLSVTNQLDRERPPVLAPEEPLMPERSGHPSEGQSEGLHYTFKWGDAEKGLSFHKSEAGLYECPYCPHQHKKKSVVRAHVRKHTGEKPYICKHCTFKCANFSWMREHLIKRHNLKSEELSTKFKEPKKSKSMKSAPAPSSIISPPPQKAPKYDFLFAPSDTEKHVELSKTNTGSYVCVFCKKELRIINNMRAHIRGHIGDKPYYCTRCPFRSAHISALRRHLFSMHRIRNAKGHKSTQQAALAMINYPRSPPRIPQPEAIPVVQPLKSSIEPKSSPIMHNILSAPRSSEIAPPVISHQQTAPRSSQHTTSKLKGPKYTYEETPTEVALLKSLQASNTLQCPHCSHKFSSISRTMEHVRKHTGAKPFRCLICNFKSAYEGCISRHVSLKHELSAQQLARFFTFKIGEIEKSTDLQKNPETGHYKCPFCEKSWPESAKVKRHMCIHTGEKPYRCNLCGFGAVDKSSMVHHLEMSHKKQITELKDNIREEEETAPPMLAAYQNQISSPSMVGRNAFTVEAKESTKLVLRRVHENSRQELHEPSLYHQVQETSRQELHRPSPYHQVQEQPSPTLLNVPSPVNSDSSDTSGYDYLPSESEKELLSKLNVEGKVKCQFCGKICHSAARTLEHIRMHSGEKPYSCKYCKFSSAYEGVMKKHVMVRHGKGTGLSVLYSFVAGKILKSIEFEREEHTGRYKCPFCEKTTTSLTGAKRHVCIHTGEKPYKCNLCSYCANERSTILWHIDRQHQNAGEHLPDMHSEHHHKVQQPQHGRVDHRKAAVTQALGLAPTAGGERSMVSINKRGHIDFSPTGQTRKVRVQPGDVDAVSKLFYFEPGKIERSLNLQRDPDNGRYLCPFCEQTSRDLTNAKNHVRVHIGEKPFKCKLCDYASVQRSLVIAHIEKHHVIYPSVEYSQQDAALSRHIGSSYGRSHFPNRAPVASSYHHRPATAAAVPYTAPPPPPVQADDMPLDLSKPLDLSSSSKKPEPEHLVIKETPHYSEDVAMDLSAGGRVQESQESSLDEEEEARLMEAEMIDEDEEMMADDEVITEEDEDLMADDDDRLLEEEILAAEEAGEDVLSKHHDEAVQSEARLAPQRPVSLVKPLNPNEVNEDEDSSGMHGDQCKAGQNVTVGVVVSNSGNPGASHSKKDERNIWDMAFNWSSGKKSSNGEDLDKPSAARSLEYADASSSSRPLDMSAEDNEDVDVDGYIGGVESEEGVLGRLLRKERSQREGGAESEHLEEVVSPGKYDREKEYPRHKRDFAH